MSQIHPRMKWLVVRTKPFDTTNRGDYGFTILSVGHAKRGEHSKPSPLDIRVHPIAFDSPNEKA